MEKMKLPQDILRIHSEFKKNNYKLYIVGGAVRDFIMGKEPHDYDLVTNATPNKVMEILKNYRTDLQGVQFGVVRVFTKDEPEGYEIASYRRDISLGRDNKGNGEKVETGDHITIEDDTKRRDLSINALFYDIETEQVVDLVGGIDDIKNKIIRTVGNPIDRFSEDRLRIMRVFRFSATNDSTIDSETDRAIRNDSRLFGISSIDDVSKERIYAEFVKVAEKSERNPEIMKRYFDHLIDYKIINQLFPDMEINYNIKETSSLSVIIAQILYENKNYKILENALVSMKLPNFLSNIILFLIQFYNEKVTSKNVFSIYSRMKSKGISYQILKEWITVMNIKDISSIKFLEYEPKTSGKTVIQDGFKGIEIGNEIARREKIRFEEMIKESVVIKKFNEF